MKKNEKLQFFKRGLLLLIIHFVSTHALKAQGSSIDGMSQRPIVIPKSPEAFSMTKYGDVPVGLNTGTIQFSLPVYVIKEGAITHSIGLEYSTNGVKVDEVASRVGIGWSLKAGGVVTRTVFDKPDDNPIFTRILNAPANVNSDSFYTYIVSATQPQADAQADEYSFSFGGYSGKFIVINGQVKQIGKVSGLKIFKGGQQPYLIITPDGFRYYFGENYSLDKSESYNLNETPARGIEYRKAESAWYLTKIKSPSGDSVTFQYAPITYNYLTGVSQFRRVTWQGFADGFYSATVSAPSVQGCPPLEGDGNDYTKANASTLEGVYLQKINFGSGHVRFSYSNRLDVNGEKKIDSILVCRSDSIVYKAFHLGFEYSNSQPGLFETNYNGSSTFQDLDSTVRKRLFLSSFSEYNSTKTNKISYGFEYDSINYLPPRLSFSQDLFGFFNGKSNTRFYPNNTFLDDVYGSLRFGGDRSFSYLNARKGTLKKITYPTGGYTALEYEPHEVFSDEVKNLVSLPDVNVQLINSTGWNQSVISSAWIGAFYGDLSVEALWVNQPLPEAIRGDENIKVSIIDVSDSSVVYDYSVLPGASYQTHFNHLLLDTKSYVLKLTASHENLTGYTTLKRKKFEIEYNVNVPLAGLRIKKTTDFDFADKIASTKLYKYNKASSPANSGLLRSSEYLQDKCVELVRSIQSNINCAYYILSSSSTQSLFINDYSTVAYSNVVEYNSTDSLNGGIEHQFINTAKSPPQPLSFTWPSVVTGHSPILSATTPWANTDYLNGTEVYTGFFKLISNERVYERKVYSYNSIASELYSMDKFYLVKKVISRSSYIPSTNYFYDYDVNKYERYYYWQRLDSMKTVSFARDGIDSIVSKTKYVYGNQVNLLPTQKSELTSTGDWMKESYTYPDNLSSPGNVYSKMLYRNVINPVVETLSELNTNGLVLSKTRYRDWFGDSTVIMPDTVIVKQVGSANDRKMNFIAYDTRGNLLEVAKDRDIKMSYIWDYNKRFPIAEITNATKENVAYTSFEADGTGNWSFSGSPITDHNAPTGQKIYNLSSGNLSKSALISTEYYTVSYWTKNANAFSIGGTVSGFPITGAVVNGWHYFEHRITGVVSISIAGSGFIDEVRLYPASAQMTTYGFDVLNGITVQCDINNRILYYEYDGFRRLALIRDQDKNILKRFCYSFTGQQIDCGQSTVPAWIAQSSTCEKSNGINTGNETIIEKDMNPASSTYTQTRSRTVSNPNACPIPSICNSSTCVGNDKKCINNVCETGVRINTGFTRIIGVGWRCYFHYKWSDNSVSAEFSEIQAERCPITL